MNWDILPDDIIKIILNFRREITCGNKAAKFIQKKWNKYRNRVLIGRFNMLKYLKDFREWNPTLEEFLSRSKL
jgi:hypothetical protein